MGAAVGGAQGAATAATVDFNNRQLHPTERQRAAELAANSKGKFTKEQIEEQMRLMGNVAFGVGPNTTEVLTTKQAIDANNVVDPGMPKVSDRVATVEILGKANPEIQQFIIANTKDGAGYIPGASPYQPSNWALNKPATTNTPPVDAVQTARCANSDLACRSGVGVQQSVPITPAQQQAAGDYFGNMSTQYQRMAALATASGNAPVVLSFEIAAGVTGLLEQAFKPSMGKVSVDSLVDVVAKEFSDKSRIPLFIVNEVVEREIKPKLQAAKDQIDSIGKKP